MRHLSVLLLILLIVAISGCAGGLGYQGMTADQISAAVKDKSAGIACVSGKYAGASVNSLFVNTDKGLSVNMTIDVDCKATFTSPAPAGSPNANVPVTVTPTK
jgi:hypothetical protein